MSFAMSRKIGSTYSTEELVNVYASIEGSEDSVNFIGQFRSDKGSAVLKSKQQFFHATTIHNQQTDLILPLKLPGRICHSAPPSSYQSKQISAQQSPLHPNAQFTHSLPSVRIGYKSFLKQWRVILALTTLVILAGIYQANVTSRTNTLDCVHNNKATINYSQNVINYNTLQDSEHGTNIDLLLVSLDDMLNKTEECLHNTGINRFHSVQKAFSYMLHIAQGLLSKLQLPVVGLSTISNLMRANINIFLQNLQDVIWKCTRDVWSFLLLIVSVATKSLAWIDAYGDQMEAWILTKLP